MIVKKKFCLKFAAMLHQSEAGARSVSRTDVYIIYIVLNSLIGAHCFAGSDKQEKERRIIPDRVPVAAVCLWHHCWDAPSPPHPRLAQDIERQQQSDCSRLANICRTTEETFVIRVQISTRIWSLVAGWQINLDRLMLKEFKLCTGILF